MSESLEDVEWNDKAIGDCMKSVAADVGIGGRESYISLYWIILDKNHGPQASSLISEMDRNIFQSQVAKLDA